MTTRADLLKEKLDNFKRYINKIADPKKLKSVNEMNLSVEQLLTYANQFLIPNKNNLDDPASELIISLGITTAKE